MKKRNLLIAAGVVVALGAAMLIPVGPGQAESKPATVAKGADLSAFAADAPGRPIHMLFIHHSVGGALLADQGAEKGQSCIWETHPSGGGLRKLLGTQGYQVHEASYDSAIGGDTDLFHWLPKFSGNMDKVLRIKHQDQTLEGDAKNEIVAFKSCFPNNQFTGPGQAPGNPNGPQLTVWDAKATMTALLPTFEKHPNVLFVYLTAPAIAPKPEKMRLYRVIARALKGKSEPGWTAKQAEWAREFNNWMVSPEGWLKEYKGKNVVVFDYYDVLTGGASNLLAYPTREGTDSHPTADGHKKAAELFAPFLNRAVRRAGLAGEGKTAAN
jgi:hypothetical protein